MISREKALHAVPAALTGPAWEADVRALCQNPSGTAHKGSRYGHLSVREALRGIYGDRCAYCEGQVYCMGAARVDHYRPRNKPKSGPADHPGYYWLTYAWSNLIQACETCNGHKSNWFPLADEASRISEPPVLTDGLPPREELESGGRLNGEKRLILNPERDPVEAHLKFSADGKAEGLTDPGRITVEICGLNRSGLVLARKQKAERYATELARKLTHYENRGADAAAEAQLRQDIGDLLIRLLQEGNPDREYSRFGVYMAEEFEAFYAERLPIGEHRELVMRLFHEISQEIRNPA